MMAEKTDAELRKVVSAGGESRRAAQAADLAKAELDRRSQKPSAGEMAERYRTEAGHPSRVRPGGVSRIIPAKYPQEQFGLPGMEPPKTSKPGKREVGDKGRGLEELRSMRREGWLKLGLKSIRQKYVFGRAAMDGEPPLSADRVPGGRNPDGSIRLPTRRPPDTRPGMIPLGGNNPADPYQYVGQPMPLPKMLPGPTRTVPPNWPARAIDNEVGRAAYPGSPEPIRIDPGYKPPRVGEVTAGAEFVQNVGVFSSHYGEGRQPKVPAWRYGI